MTDEADKPSDAAMAEAAEWYWRVREPEVSEGELDDWQRWLAESPGNRHAFDRIENALRPVSDIDELPWPTERELVRDRYDGSQSVSAWLQEDAGSAAADSPARAFVRRRPFLSLAAMAASVSIVVSIVAVLGYLTLGPFDGGTRIPDVVAYRTAPAEHRDVALPDGSSIALGGSTRVSIAYRKDIRRIELQSGEAFFDAAADPERPFEVTASGRRIVAVGTAFNVSRQAGRVTVTVTDGRVVVEQEASPSDGRATRGPSVDDRTARLEAGQRLIYDGDDLQPISFASAEDALAWRNGMLKYRGEKLRFVVADVNRYTNVPIRIVDDAAGDLRVTGTVFQNSVDSWVDGLAATFPVTVERSGAGVAIHSKGAQ